MIHPRSGRFYGAFMGGAPLPYGGLTEIAPTLGSQAVVNVPMSDPASPAMYGGPLDKSSVRKGWLIYIGVMLAFYVLIKVFGDSSPSPAQAPPPSPVPSSHTAQAAH